MSDLSQLSPQPLWNIFAKICAIPHPSYHEEALAKYIVQWAKEQSFHVERDAVGNILIRKPATTGLENLIPVVLQAHLDMVPQKNNNIEHDFTKDPIRTAIKEGWLTAVGTTLGADNGIGMASALAVLADNNLSHGPLEVLLTMTEEAGMEGAFGLQPNWLQAEILINTDSETDGEIYMGCAGGVDVFTHMPIIRETTTTQLQHFTLKLSGLKGGHSGADIHLGLGNANKLMARFLFAYAEKLGLRLININGGTLRNAIPRDAQAEIAVPVANVEQLKTCVDEYLITLNNELSLVEKNIALTLFDSASARQPLSLQSQSKLLALLNAMPNGLICMSNAVEGVTETSLNVGVITSYDDKIEIVCLIRSLIDSGKDYIVDRLKSLGQLAGATVEIKGGYPGWQPDPDSRIMHLVSETYQRLFNITPEVMVIHAGLECGLLKKPYPNMDMVSFGPTIMGAHSPDERADIASVGRYWELLTQLLVSIPQKK